MSALSKSSLNSSTPAALPCSVIFKALLTSCIRHLSKSISSISSSSSPPSSSTGFIGTSLFSISLKCSTHLCSRSCASVLITPCLFSTPTSCLLCSQAHVLVMLYSLLHPIPLILPPSNSAYPPSHLVSLCCFLHCILAFFSVLNVLILHFPS